MSDAKDGDSGLHFDEFPPPTYEAWQAAAVNSQAGKPFEKLISPSYEGIPIRPLYHREDTAGLQFTATLPNKSPYVRGQRADSKYLYNATAQQVFGLGRPADLNRALRAIMQGGGGPALLLDGPTRAGLDPDAAALDEVGRGGLSLATVGDLVEAFDDFFVIGPFVHCGASALPVVALLAAFLQNDPRHSTKDWPPLSPLTGPFPIYLDGCVAADPLGVLAEEGVLPLPLEEAYDQMAHLARWAAFKTMGVATAVVRADIYHDAGANAVQELAFGLATSVAYLRAQFARVGEINIAARSLNVRFAIGGQFFMEVAKLRAARLLWAQVVEAFGIDERSAELTIYACTARRNKSAIDPHVNMLRAATEALAATIGGADRLCVTPFDETFGTPDDFSRRIARNVLTILSDEANLRQFIDPAGGSYAVETLTDRLAHEAWALFQEIERQGGMAAALESGFIQSSVAAVAEKRATALATRRDVLVGVNQFANPTEQPRPAPPADDTLYAERAAQLAAHRANRDADACAAALAELSRAMAAAPERVVDAAAAAAEAGATLGEMATALCRNTVRPGPTVIPLSRARAAEPFEALRAASFSLRERAGERATSLFLANLGPPHQHKARADFAQGFFEVGGFHVITNNGFATPDETATAAVESGAPVVVICSTDETYPDLVPPLVAAIRSAAPQTVIILAGRPAEQVEALRAAGVDEFIYMGANALALNTWLLERIEDIGV